MNKIWTIPGVMTFLFVGCFLDTEEPWGPVAFVESLGAINTEYDEFNSAGPSTMSLEQDFIFSTNAGTAGDNFDIWKAHISFSINKATSEEQLPGGDLPISAYKIAPFLHSRCNTLRDELGPFLATTTGKPFTSDIKDSAFISGNGLYLYSTEDSSGRQNIHYLINGKHGTFWFNSDSDDCYATYHEASQTIFFCSNRDGDFNIYKVRKPDHLDLEILLRTGNGSGAEKVDAFNSLDDEKCPYVMDNLIVFVSNKGSAKKNYDIYISRYDGSSWTTPCPLPAMETKGRPVDVNTPSNEYRPALFKGADDQIDEFYVLIFSSDRPRYTFDTRTDYDLYCAAIPKSYID